MIMGTVCISSLIPAQVVLRALEATNELSLPSELKISGGRHMIFSIYDKDYAPYSHPQSTAVWSAVPADNRNEVNTIDYQGKIPPEGIDIKIPISYTGSVQGLIPDYTSEPIPIDPNGEQGVSYSTRKLVLSWESQYVAFRTKFINAKIKPEDGRVLNVKKLDVNGGIGKDTKGVLLAKFPLPNSSNVSNAEAFEVRVIAGVPDKKFNTLIGGQYRHKFIYIPMIGADGKVWLNNNLGAKVSDLNSLSTFNPLKQADKERSIDNYGSLFQWGRDSDGHELINWYIENGVVKTSWVYRTNVWYDRAGVTMNDFVEPCPEGFVTPSGNDWDQLVDVVGQYPDISVGGYYITPTPNLHYDQYYYTRPPYLMKFSDGGSYWIKSLVPVNGKFGNLLYYQPARTEIRYDPIEEGLYTGKTSNYSGGPNYGYPIRCLAK